MKKVSLFTTLREQGLNSLCMGIAISRSSGCGQDTIYRLWNLGLMDYTAEYGWEVVSWALMPLGLTWIVDHRIWRAQIRLVMPLVDQVRLSVVSYLCGYGGRSWLVDEVNNLVASSTFGSRTIKSCWAAEFSELIAILDNPAYCTARAVELLQALRLAFYPQ